MKVSERCFRIGVIAFTPDEAVDAVGIGPVRLDRNSVESSFLDETARDGGALRIELMRAMRRLADKDDLRTFETQQQRIEVARFGMERECGMSDHVRRRRRCRDSGWRVGRLIRP